MLQLREIPDVTIVESLVTCARTVCPPQKGEKVMTSFPLGIVCTVARAGNGQRNAALNSTRTANPLGKLSRGCPLQTPIGAFKTEINIRECREIHSFRPLCSHPRGSAGLDLVITNELILKEQDQVIIAPTGVWGPLPSGTVSLILGRSILLLSLIHI